MAEYNTIEITTQYNDNDALDYFIDHEAKRLGGKLRFEYREHHNDKLIVKYFVNGLCHREYGPAMVQIFGKQKIQFWYLNGEIHREHGPALIEEYNNDILKMWYSHGKLHNKKGPALVNGTRIKWYIDNIEYTFIDWLEVSTLSKKIQVELKLNYHDVTTNQQLFKILKKYNISHT